MEGDWIWSLTIFARRHFVGISGVYAAAMLSVFGYSVSNGGPTISEVICGLMGTAALIICVLIGVSRGKSIDYREPER